MKNFILRPYEPADCSEMAQLFYDTVHTVCQKDYTPRQLDAWATGTVDTKRWNEKFLKNHTVVAETDGKIAGYGDMEESGYLDFLYVHKDHQGEGIATAICDELEGAAKVSLITVHASKTAKLFFEKRGYRVIKEQQVERPGVLITNYEMCKDR